MKKLNIFYKILVLAFGASIFAEGILLPIYAIFVQKIGGDILDAGFAMGIFLITEGIFMILIHRKKWDSRQRIFLMVGGWIIWLLGIITYLFISNIWILFISQVLTAMGNAIADPVFDAELSSHIDKDVEEMEWGVFEGSKDLIGGAAAIIGGVIAFRFGFPVLIYFMVGTATISLTMILFYIAKLRSMKPKDI